MASVTEAGDAGLLEYRDQERPIAVQRLDGSEENPSPAVLFWGRLDNRAQLANLLGCRDNVLWADDDLVRLGWTSFEERLPEHLIGDFALVIVDYTRPCVFLARDPLGVKPLFYTRQHEHLWFASSPVDLLKRPELSFTREPEWMARYLLNLSMSESHTAYRELLKLPPGHSLRLSPDGTETLRRYHQWIDDAPTTVTRDERWVEAYRVRLEESVRCRMSADGVMASENSGGLDSATITAYLARLLDPPGDRLLSLAFATCAEEPGYVLETSQFRDVVHNYVITHQNPVETLDDRIQQSLRVLGFPEEHAVSSGHLPFYRVCQGLGIHALFSGFGGDEVVTYSGHLLQRELLDQRQWRQLHDVMTGNSVSRALRVGRMLWRERQPADCNPHYLASFQARWAYRLVNDAAIDQYGLEALHFAGACHDAPFRRIHNFMVEGTLKRPFIATRLENCTLMAAAHGIEYRWPLWDVRLVQQYLSTPSIEKLGPRGTGRYLHRRAVDGVVPQRVAWKSNKDMGYARMIQELNSQTLVPLARRMRALEADLAPDLREIVDRKRLRTMTELALAGNMDHVFAFSFRRGAIALVWLDAWLKGYHGT